MVDIPADGLLDSRLEILLRPPAELALELAGIDGIAAVVAGTIRHETDQSVDESRPD